MNDRSYDQFCGLAHALDLVGDRWTLLIVRDLMIGPQRYSDLIEGLPGLGSGLLAARLKRLKDAQIIRRAKLPPPASSVVAYELTTDGVELAHAVLPLALWGARRLDRFDESMTFRPGWLLFSLWAQFKPAEAMGVHDVYEFHVGDEVVHAIIDDGAMTVARGSAPSPPDFVAIADPKTFFDVGIGRVSVEEAVRSGTASFEGSWDAVLRALRILGPSPPTEALAG